MKIIVSKVMKAKTSYSSQRETVVTSSFRACSFAMDDGGRCLLDVINDPKLLQSFLESGSDENSKDPQDGTSSESAVESPQVSRSSHPTLANHLSSAEHIVDHSEQMGYTYAVDGQGLLTPGGVVCSSASGLGGMSLVVAASSVGPQTYQHASSSGATIHHLPSSVTHTNLHPHSPASARSVTPISHSIKSPGQGPSSVHSMPPPSPLQQTRSPLPSHTPSPAPAWSPAPPVLSPATSRTQSTMPSVAFQQSSHNQILQTTCSVTQFVTAMASQQSVGPKLTLQQQQQLFLQQQLSPASQQQPTPRLTAVPSPVVTTTAVAVQPSMVQLIHAPASNVALPTRTSHSAVRPIQPKLPPQILPKPATCTASNQFVSPAPAPKPPPPTPVTSAQRTVGVGIQPGVPSQLVIGQGQPGVFSGPQGTILLNQIIPGMGQSPILIQNLSNLPGLQLTLRQSNSASPGQSMNASNPQNNATLIAALQGPSQHAQTLFAQAKSPVHGQQTIVIPNNIGHPGLTSQNINLTSNSGILSSSSQGQGLFARSNIILSPRVVGGNQQIQLQQIQTPNGPIFFAPSQTIAVPHLPAALGNAQLAPVTVPMHGVMTTNQGVISGLSIPSHASQSALQQQQQSLFGTVPFTSHLEQSSPQVIQVPQPMAPQQVPTNHPAHLQNQQQIEHSPKPASPPKPSKVPSVNLEELLKEHGIVPENSPLHSPDCHSPLMEEPVPSHPIVPSPQLITALQSQQVVLEQPQGHTASPQFKLAFTQDGSVILQQHGGLSNAQRVQHYFSSGQVHGRTVNNTVGSVILPTVTTSTVSVPAVTSEATASRNHSTLIARLNAGPAISVPDVSSLALTTSIGISTTTSITTTTITTSGTTLVPLSVNSSPITSSYVVQRTNMIPSAGDRVLIAEDVHTSQSHATPVISTSSSVQSVQNRINHTSSAYQSLAVPNEHPNRTTVTHAPKTVQSLHAGVVSTTSSQPELPKCGHRETHLVEVSDNGTAVPSHNHPTFSSIVPNNIQQRLQKEIADLGIVKSRNAEQQKMFQLLLAAQQKLVIAAQNKGRGNRTNQNQLQLKIEAEVEKLISKAQTSHSTNNEPTQQLQVKAPVLATQQQPQQQQQSNQAEKQQQQQNVNSKALNSHNLHLVNLLKQNSPHAVPPKHIAPPTTTVTTVCDSTTPAIASVTPHQKVNQVIAPSQPRLQTAHHQCSKNSSEVTQQVIVRLQKPPPQQQPVQPCPNIVQVKREPPVKRVVNTIPKPVLFNEQLLKDQNGAVNPDVKTPFSSKDDACRRLLKFHVFNTRIPSEDEMHEADERFGEESVKLLEKMKKLNSHYRFLQLKESMRLSSTPDQVLMERLYIQDEEEALRADKAAVAEGKTLSLPPPPAHWLQQFKAARRSPSPVETPAPPITIKEEKDSDQEDQDSYSRDHPTPEDSDPLYKEDDNLEAPVIDSCEDIMVPQHDDNCERSPPTLKRIVIKPSKYSESDSEEPAPSKKRFKFNNNPSFKSEPAIGVDWNRENSLGRPVLSKHSDKEYDSKTNHKYPLLTRETFQSDNRLDDIEFDMSPMEIGEDVRASSHVVDYDPPSGTNHLADFEPPVARTDESCDSTLLYNNSLRNNCADKYDFDLLACSDWTEEYVHHQPNESDVAVENIMGNHDNPSDLDLSGLDGLDDHLNDTSEHCIPNGIPDDTTSVESEMNYIGYHIPKHPKRFPDSSAQSRSNCTRDHQVQSAIKSIMGTSNESRSFFDGVGADFLPLNRHSHNAHIAGYSNSVDMGGTSSQRGEPDLEEAVRSILL